MYDPLPQNTADLSLLLLLYALWQKALEANFSHAVILNCHSSWSNGWHTFELEHSCQAAGINTLYNPQFDKHMHITKKLYSVFIVLQ